MKTNKVINKEYCFLTSYELVCELRKVNQQLQEAQKDLLSDIYQCSDFFYNVEEIPNTIDSHRLKQYSKSFQRSISDNISKMLELNARKRCLGKLIKEVSKHV